MGEAILDTVATAYEQAEQRLWALKAAHDATRPAPLFRQEGDAALGLHTGADKVGSPYQPSEVALLREWPRHLTMKRIPALEEILPANVLKAGYGVPSPKAQARADEIVAAWDAWQAEKNDAEARRAYAVADEELDRVMKAQRPIENAIMAVTATTMAGLLAKARVAAVTAAGGLEDEIEKYCAGQDDACLSIALSLVRDLLALAPEKAV